MTVYFQFTRDIGGKVVCMENLCALNPLDHFFVDVDLVQCLFYDFPLGKQQEAISGQESARQTGTKTSVIQEMMTAEQYRKLKPTFKKLIS